MHALTQDLAARLAAAAELHALELGIPVSIAVVDASGVLARFVRVQGSPLVSVEISQNKAFTSAAMQVDTAGIVEAVQPGNPLYTAPVSHSHVLTAIPGGLVLKSGDTVIGGLGVSGGSVDQDVAIAAAALASVSL
ncbi:GlcG/HbpS family heme-binding protein [Microbacterium sp. BR1]|uniref:GlcG/HbpS family heme-binding protein n=1 Tax=Microbacterium sp. BR1 TaxID=1070896 RepID=UPI000C2C9579|nr:heme-binding protein [Microbacterium sp. BR1]